MKLLVHVIEARNLPPTDPNGLSDPYVKLQLGKSRSKSKVMKKNLNPRWDEECEFRVGDLSDELLVSVMDEDKYFTDDFIGQVKVPLLKVFDAKNLSLGTAWYQLQPKSKKLMNMNCGEICLTISLSQKNFEEVPKELPRKNDDLVSDSDISGELLKGRLSVSSNGEAEAASSSGFDELEPLKEEQPIASVLVDRLRYMFGGKKNEESGGKKNEESGGKRNEESSFSSSKDLDAPENLSQVAAKPKFIEEQTDYESSRNTYDELLKVLESKDQGSELPVNLQGGVLLDQIYVAAPVDLNFILFAPTSDFRKSLAEIQGTTGLQAEAWKLENGGEFLKRVVKYTTAPTKLIKSVTATEEQTYLKADGKNYVVSVSVSTPDVPFGNTFRTELLYCIMPGPELSSQEQSSHLVISWRTNFVQSTIMKSMIENGARQGLKDSYAQFAGLLSQKVKPVDPNETVSSKEQILASLQSEQESDWKLAYRFFGNFTVVSFIFVTFYILSHILLANSSLIQGLEFPGLDLPDSVGEIVVCGVLVLQGQQLLSIVGRFLHARSQRGSDHGIKAHGDGWLLTIALIEGSNLAGVDSTGYSDPYVTFTCNGKTKTSSIKFQTLDPQWNEIFEFDAMEDPPSVMAIDVYDFDGPFDEATSLGHAEINFVKSNLSDLADIWIPLRGKLSQACQSKLHLRIFLQNTRGTQIYTDYLMKMEKEVGKKIALRSPQTNSAFQKLFGLPPEEFLINNFTCHLKRKMPLQGRLFLSPRILGFYTNLFGHKTKFFFLWEDIDDIQVIPPTLSSMGTPSLLIILRKGRGLDVKYAAKALDSDGRLRFQFQSFVSFGAANRTIMALWKARALSPEQKMQIIAQESGERTLQSEESGSFLGIPDVKMTEILSSVVEVNINSLMELFGGSSLEQTIMEKVGCFGYSVTPWEAARPEVYQRQINYKFDNHVYRYGGGVTSTQQKSPLSDKNGWLIEEVLTLQGIMLGDYFNLHLRYQIEDLSPKLKACNVQVFVGVAWLKSTKHEKKVTRNVLSNSSIRVKEMFCQLENELMLAK